MMQHWLRPLLAASAAALLLHTCGLGGIAYSLATSSALQQRADPLLTRTISAQDGPAPGKGAPDGAAPPAPPASPAPLTPAATTAVPAPTTPKETTPTVTLDVTPTVVVLNTATTIEPTPTLAAATSTLPTPEPSPTLAAASSATTTLASGGNTQSIAGWTWPPDTRLNYKVGGFYRGELFGTGQVQWSKYKAASGAGEEYQVQIALKVAIMNIRMTSQGRVLPDQLLPQVYEEQIGPAAPRNMRVISPVELRLSNGTGLGVPPAAQGKVQDSASQFVDLSYRFATGQTPLEAGKTVTVWMARPGGLDEWVYDIAPAEILYLPKLGPVPAFHLTPRPIANPRGNIVMEMWYAPSLQYLPVRIKILQGKEVNLDLLVDSIEQK